MARSLAQYLDMQVETTSIVPAPQPQPMQLSNFTNRATPEERGIYHVGRAQSFAMAIEVAKADQALAGMAHILNAYNDHMCSLVDKIFERTKGG